MTRWLLALTGLLALAGAGCIKVDQELTLNPDGSADVKVHYAMTEQAFAQLEAMKKMAEQNPDVKVQTKGPDMIFDEKKLREEFDKNKGDGDELKSLKIETKEGWKHVTIEAHSRDLAAAAKASRTGGTEGGYALTRNADGNYVLEMTGGKSGLGGDKNENLTAEQKAQQQAMMKAMMAGLRVAIKVTVPGDVIETTAPEKDKRTASWVLDIGDDKFFEKSENLGKQGAKVVFSGKGLNLKEFKVEPKAEKAPGKGAGKTGEPN